MIDRVVEAVASRVRFSSPSVRALSSSSSTKPVADSLNPEKALDTLQDMYRMLTARDAKWLTRLILKSYEPVVMIDPAVIYRAYHPLLPSVMHVHDHFALAGATLKRLDQEREASQSPLGHKALMRHLVPVLGFKVGRQPWHKGRSIKQCLNMGYGRMTCEEKLDGEYCQIHIDLSKGRDCIQIFSKSGKDSTQDRKALHEYAGAPPLPLLQPAVSTLDTNISVDLSASPYRLGNRRVLSPRAVFSKGSWSSIVIRTNGFLISTTSGNMFRARARS